MLDGLKLNQWIYWACKPLSIESTIVAGLQSSSTQNLGYSFHYLPSTFHKFTHGVVWELQSVLSCSPEVSFENDRGCIFISYRKWKRNDRISVVCAQANKARHECWLITYLCHYQVNIKCAHKHKILGLNKCQKYWFLFNFLHLKLG